MVAGRCEAVGSLLEVTVLYAYIFWGSTLSDLCRTYVGLEREFCRTFTGLGRPIGAVVITSSKLHKSTNLLHLNFIMIYDLLEKRSVDLLTYP